MDPVTIGMFIAGCAFDCVKSVLGNRLDASIVSIVKSYSTKVNSTEMLNHDLQRAVNKSYYLSMQKICSEAIASMKRNKEDYKKSDIKLIEKKVKKLSLEIQKNQYSEIVIPLLDSVRQIEILIGEDPSCSCELMEKVKDIITAQAMLDLSEPEVLKQYINNNIFEYMKYYFSREIKYNPAVKNIFEAKLLTEVNNEIKEMGVTIKSLSDNMYKVDNIIATTIPTSGMILSKLNDFVEICRKNDVPFRTPHLLLILFLVPNSITMSAFNSIKPGLGNNLMISLKKYVYDKHKELEKGNSFTPFQWIEKEEIKFAQIEAYFEDFPYVTEKYLLLGVLNSSSHTIEELRTMLKDDFFKLLSIVKELPPINSNLNKTPGNIFDKEKIDDGYSR